MNKQEDRVLRAAMERRAAKVPALSDDFQANVMARLRKTHPSSPLKGRGKLRRWWLMVPAIGAAAAVVVGLFILKHEPKIRTIDEQPQIAEMPTPAPVPKQEEGVVTTTPITAEVKPQDVSSKKTVHSAPSPTGRAGGGSSEEDVAGVSDLYATIDAMTDQALREAERLTIETLSRNVAAEQPS